MTYPRTDEPFISTYVQAFQDRRSIETSHKAVEDLNTLYRLAHAALKVSVDMVDWDTPKVTAFNSGIKAYEILSQPHVTSTTVDYDIVYNYLRFNSGDLFDFLNEMSLDVASTKTTMPVLTQAVREIAAVELDDNSQELSEYAVYGGATIRAIELEILSWQDTSDISELFDES